MTIERSVLVALFLLGGARAAAAWPALPGPPAPPAEEPVPVAAPRAAPEPRPAAPAPIPLPPPAVRPRPVVPAAVVEQQPPPPPEGTTEGEWLRAGGQILLGTATMVLLGGAAIALAEGADLAPVAGLVLLGAPVAGGYVVCGIGRTSRYYTGNCGPAVGGAYLAAVTGIPLALLIYAGCEPDPAYASYEGRAGECIGPALGGFAIGYTIGAALGATIGWHIGKKPRLAVSPVPDVSPPARDERLELGRGPSLSTPRGLRFTLPVVAFSF